MRKTRLQIFAVTLILLFMTFSCSQDIDSYSDDSQSGFDKEKLIELSSHPNPEEQNSHDTPGTLIREMDEFKSFTQVFFALWAAHIEKTSPVLDYFNRRDISLDEKIEHAYVLAEAYRDFKREIELIDPPEIALKIQDAAVKALTYRILFFEGYTSNATISELNELENNAYLEEALFWEELDKIYSYFEEMAIGEFDNNKNISMTI